MLEVDIAAMMLRDGVVRHDPKKRGDAALVEEFLSGGEEECFERLVDRYKEKVHRLTASVMGPAFSGEAEGITQEVFIQVYRKLSTFRQDSRFSTWLYRIAYNLALERKRKARFSLPHQGADVLGSMAAEQIGPLEAAANRLRNRAVLDGVESLDEPYRTAIYLHYWMKRPVCDIAESLGTRPGTVKSYLHRGRKRLARILEKERDDG
jgi:RNA polymerase sigma-70 factor (ECF subfamily)